MDCKQHATSEGSLAHSKSKLLKNKVSDGVLRWGQLSGLVGVVCLGLGFILGALSHDGGKKFFHAYLVSGMYFLSIALGALFFVILQHLTRAGWSVVVRRLAELLAANLPLMGLLLVPVVGAMLMGYAGLYSWVDASGMAHDPVLWGKRAYLNVPFFTLRFVGYVVIWTGLSYYFLSRSVKQDQTGDPALTAHMQKMSAPAMLLFGLTCTLGAFDFLMSLDPHWYSTIFGVYFFAGSVLGFLACVTLMALGLQRVGALNALITVEHYHDLGKLMFGFVFFWGYIAFSQFMLIWYGNMPEETQWYVKRQSGDWLWVSWVLLFGHFLIPFPGLLSRHAKRRVGVLAFWAAFLLVMHGVDLYWLIMPSFAGPHLALGFLDATCFVGMGGLFYFNFVRLAHTKARWLVPIQDPRLEESLALENI